MNQYVTGAVIKELREKSQLTQSELAAKLNVSDKAILDLFDTIQYQIIEKGLRKEIITKS